MAAADMVLAAAHMLTQCQGPPVHTTLGSWVSAAQDRCADLTDERMARAVMRWMDTPRPRGVWPDPAQLELYVEPEDQELVRW